MKKNFKYSLIFLSMAVLVVGITLFVNVLASTVDIKWDMTSNKMYSIGKQTETVVNGLKKEVDIVMLSDKEQLKSESGDLGFILVRFLEQYEKFENINVKFVDPDKNPGIVRDLDDTGILKPKQYDIIVKCDNKKKKLSIYDIFAQDSYGLMMFHGEQAVTGAISYVTSENTPIIYFADSNSSRKLNSEYTILKSSLQHNNFDVKLINLAAISSIPEDATILLLAAPDRDLSLEEKNKVSDYLKGGGNAIFLFDPINSEEGYTNFDDLFEEYTVALNYDRVKENNPQRHIANRPYDIVVRPEPCDITNEQDLSKFTLIMPASTSFKRLINDKEPLTITPLLTTSESSVGEIFGGVMTEEIPGPVDVGLIAEYNSAVNTKIAFIGNAYFVTDEAYASNYPYSQSSIQLMALTLDWMYDKSNEVFILPKNSNYDSITLSGLNATATVVVIVLVFPILIVAAGLIIWLRRRHL